MEHVKLHVLNRVNQFTTLSSPVSSLLILQFGQFAKRQALYSTEPWHRFNLIWLSMWWMRLLLIRSNWEIQNNSIIW